MNSAVLPPSPNWYLSNILACSKRKTLAWGAKNCIVIAKQKENDLALEFNIIQDAHIDRVTALAFCPKFEPNSPELIISCGDDDKAKIWNIDQLELFTIFSFADDKPIVGVDWSNKDNNLACAVNSQGYLLSCNTQYQTAKKITLGKLKATYLACCPHEANLVAVGSKCGLIYIVNLDNNGSILYKLRGHDDEVVSLSWCPSDVNVLSTDYTRDLLLASSAKDKSVFIWRAGKDGRCETVINLPNLPVTSQSYTSQPHKSKLSTTCGAWIAVCWAEPRMLITSSVWGELLSWDLSVNSKKVKQHELLHTYHNRGLFCIATIPKCNEVSENWRKDSELTIWTLAQDRWVVCCSKRENKPAELKYKIPTQGGYIYCVAACPIDTSRIAFGVGDMMLRSWNLSEPHVATFDVTMFWQKIKGKLRVIAWQPENERLLAFGTSEGRVGLIDILKNVPILFKQYHRKVIYKLEWGSVPNKSDLGVYSCSEGELVVYDVKNPNKGPMSIIKEECTEFSWKPDNLMLAIALENGRILFYDRNLKKCGNMIYLSKKTVNCLVWHPESTAVDTLSSPMKDYLAVASDSSTILIYDISDLRKELETQEKIVDLTENGNNEQRNMHKLVATLNGHSDRVVCLAWSPHVTGYLVSGSYDCTAQVWDVEKQELMGTYVGHSGPVLCCMWSPLKPQLIITGSSDFTLSIWDYTLSEQSPKPFSEDKKKKPKYKAQKYRIQNVQTITSEAHNETLTNSSKGSVNHSSVSITEIVETKSQSELVKDMGKKKEKKQSYFPIYNKMMNEKHAVLNCIKNDIRKNEKQDSELENKESDYDSVTSSLFSGKEALQIIVAKEKLGHTLKYKNDTIIEMDMWCNNLQQNIECAIKEKRLNDFLVSLSTSLSVKTWRETCEAYAHQLIMEGNVEKAVSYLLCVHKIYEAIKAFVDARMYKEAYVLARFKLADDDPTLAVVLQSWAHYATTAGQLEQAAHCYIKLGELIKAAKLLSRRYDPECLEIASQLALMSGDVEFSISIAEDAMMRALVKLDYSKARFVIENIQELQHLKIYIDAYESLMSTYKQENQCDSVQRWIAGKSDHGVLQDLKERHNASHYNALQRSNAFLTRTITNNSEMELFLHASYQIALAATSDVKETQLKHITTALDYVYQYQMKKADKIKNTDLDPFSYILITLDIKKPTGEDSIYAKSNYFVSTSIRAYLCVGLMNWAINILSQLSIDEEIQFMKIIETLLEDVFNLETRDHMERIFKIEHMKHEVQALLFNKVNGTSTIEEDKLCKSYELMKLDVKNFIEKRICVPNLNIAHKLVHNLHKILRDCEYQTQFFEVLHKYREYTYNETHSDTSSETEEEKINLYV
ncbi:gem-associated protein 5 [Harpegnathos saltator]|uniref:gem-associated protein 5 n=1 Tax=Harpegnathos saltator TaxID=610380 RepID=UPI000DBEEAF5|nr:gem-associated protein 5 [Harpegnathos saltator]XP_025162759.1 gem-associated protein 5 [Harpegnathos saltator]